MPANSMINSTFQKIGVFGRTQRGNRMLRILLADDDPVFLSRMEHLLMQYAAQRQLNIQIGSYTRDDISSYPQVNWLFCCRTCWTTRLRRAGA